MEQRRKSENLETEWNEKLSTANTNIKKTQDDAEKRVKTVKVEAQKRYDELRKSEVENASKEIQRELGDKLKKAIQEKNAAAEGARMKIKKIEEEKPCELDCASQRIKEL